MIKITTKEIDIFQTLLDASHEQNCDSIIRVAGGWPRDKLMGRESDDIDVTIDNLSGLTFAIRVAQHLGLGDKIGVIKANPDKSKHVETAVMNILGQEVQFTGFRKESYTDESRIPTIEHGSLLEETYRRDFTINSLYYNLNDGKIEDVSGQGIIDIRRCIIRLMVPPKKIWERMGIKDLDAANKKSFTDDPLRVLRAIRFACRFNFGLDKGLVEAALCADVLEAFKKKVSRERMQIELRKMLTGPQPARAISLMKDLGFFDTVFPLPEGYLYWDMDQNTPYHDLNVWEHTFTAMENLQTVTESMDISENDKFVINLATLLHDTGKLNPKVHGKKKGANGLRTTYYGHERYSIIAAKEMLEGLPGIRASEIKRVQLLIEGSGKTNPNYTPGNQNCNLSNKGLSKFVKLMGDDWQLAIVINMADATSKRKDGIKDFAFNYHANMMQRIRSLGPKKIMNMKPLLNGDEVIEIIGREPGPWIGNIMTKMLEWQFKNPKVTRKDAEGFVKSFI